MSSKSSEYRTSPDHSETGWPKGIAYIVGNEACERFSFYGMKSILFVHLASLYVLAGEVTDRAEDLATSNVHLFIAGVYAFPMIGAIVAEKLLGKYHTIIALSLVYCLGHAVLSIGENSLTGMFLGLGLIAIGSGGIKPCVSAHVGDQFGRGNWGKLKWVFLIFYFSINFGSFFSTILIPWTREYVGTSVAFAIPGVLMFVATIWFWMGRHTFIHVQPEPGGKLGLLDAVSGTFLFMSVGQLFVTSSMSIWIILPVAVACLVIGFALFAVRQSLQPDDGFLAITVYAVLRFFGHEQEPTKAAVGAGESVGVPATEVPPAELEQVADAAVQEQAAGDVDMSWIARSSFFGPAVKRFGLEATEGPVAVFKIISVFFLVSVFWALFDQHSSSWIRQATMMNREFGDVTLLPSQIGALNPLMVMGLIPLMGFLYVTIEKYVGIKVTPLRRMTAGMFVTAFAFVAVALIQMRIDAEGKGQVHVLWQVAPYLIITIAEVLVSITGLEFAYSQAPKRMKSIVMGFWMLTVSLGNVLVAVIARIPDMPLVSFFWLFAGLMGAAGLLFGVRAYFYTPKDYPQD